MSDFEITRGARQEYRRAADGRSYFSVSQILEVLLPGTFDRVPANRLLATREKGTDLHYWFAKVLGWKAELTVRPEAPDGIAGYVQAMMTWADDYAATPVMIETPSCSDEGYAGTPDTLALCRPYPGKTGPQQRQPTIVDLKSGTAKAADIVQIQLYRRLRQYDHAKQLLLLYVKPDGTYVCVPVLESAADLAWALNGLAVLQGRLNRGV